MFRRTADGVVAEDQSTPERMVLYYTKALAPGETTPGLSDTIRIDESVAQQVNKVDRWFHRYLSVPNTTVIHSIWMQKLNAVTDAQCQSGYQECLGRGCQRIR